MKYKVPPGPTVHGGYYFGKASDDPYRFTTANTSGGYHVVMRASGDMQLYRHTVGVTTGTQIGSTIATAAPVADITYRGGYHGLSNGSITDLTTRPFWRNLVITQL